MFSNFLNFSIIIAFTSLSGFSRTSQDPLKCFCAEKSSKHWRLQLTFDRILLWILTKKKKGIEKLIDKTYFVELFLLNILVKEIFYFHQEITVLGSKYWKISNSTARNNVKFFGILDLVPSFVVDSRKFFLPK